MEAFVGRENLCCELIVLSVEEFRVDNQFA